MSKKKTTVHKAARRTKSVPLLVRVAYHEAGHAVAAAHFEMDFQYVTIEPAADSLGHIFYLETNRTIEPETSNSRAHHALIECCAITSLAGAPAAGLIQNKPFDWRGAESDIEDATALLAHLSFDAELHEKHMAYIKVRAKVLVNGYAKAVKQIADSLITRKTLSWSEVNEIIQPNVDAKVERIVKSLTGQQHSLAYNLARQKCFTIEAARTNPKPQDTR